MRTHSFLRVAQRLISTVGKAPGVRVIFQGDRAYTDGKTVVLPAVVPGGYLSKKEAAVLMGYLDHETGHILESDFEVFKSVPKGKGLRRYLLNVFEDVREENKYIEKYPGAREDLDALADALDENSLARVEETPNWGEESQLAAVISCIYDEAYTYRDRNYYLPKRLEEFECGNQIKKVMGELPKTKTTKEVLELAEKVEKLLMKAFEKEIEEAQKKGKNSEEYRILLGGRDIEGQTPASVLDAMAEELNGEKGKIEIIEVLMGPYTKEQGSGGEKSWGKQIFPPLTTADDQILVSPAGNLEAYHRTIAGLREPMVRMRRALSIFLRSRFWKKWDHGRVEGTLDPAALWGIKTGSLRLYKEPRSSLIQGGAGVIMADLSGSMDDVLLREAMVLLCEAAMTVPKIKLQIMGFTTIGDPKYVKKKGYGRVIPLYVPIFKGFNESLKNARARIGAVGARNYTPLGEAYAMALDQVLTRPEKKKFVWVITDGQPSFAVADDEHSDLLLMKKVHQQAKKVGVKTLALNIGRSGMEDYVDYSRTVTHSGEMTSVVLDMAKEIIMGAV